MVRVGSGSAFRGWVGFGEQTFGDVPLGFQGFGALNTSLDINENLIFLIRFHHQNFDIS